eukprot:NODE_410_length_9177_cov_0.515091.p3 type:complete len:373 gc:universal NODE_410_length_9177_cov_0.515091:4748-5866(+)
MKVALAIGYLALAYSSFTYRKEEYKCGDGEIDLDENYLDYARRYINGNSVLKVSPISSMSEGGFTSSSLSMTGVTLPISNPVAVPIDFKKYYSDINKVIILMEPGAILRRMSFNVYYNFFGSDVASCNRGLESLKSLKRDVKSVLQDANIGFTLKFIDYGRQIEFTEIVLILEQLRSKIDKDHVLHEFCQSPMHSRFKDMDYILVLIESSLSDTNQHKLAIVSEASLQLISVGSRDLQKFHNLISELIQLNRGDEQTGSRILENCLLKTYENTNKLFIYKNFECVDRNEKLNEIRQKHVRAQKEQESRLRRLREEELAEQTKRNQEVLLQRYKNAKNAEKKERRALTDTWGFDPDEQAALLLAIQLQQEMQA